MTKDVFDAHTRQQIADLKNLLDESLGYLDDPPCDEVEFTRQVQGQAKAKGLTLDIADAACATQAVFAVLGSFEVGPRMAMLRKFLEPN